MPVRKTASRKIKINDLGTTLTSIPVQGLTTKIMYVVLLIAFFVMGYLFGKNEVLQKGSTPTVANNTAPAAAAGQPTAAPTLSAQQVLQKLTPSNFPAQGNANAKVTLVEFADFRCPFCEQFYTNSEPQFLKDYVDTGKVKFEFKNYAFLGPASTVAANASECANDQGKFWDMYNYFYKNQPDESDTSMYTVANLTQIAGTLGMDTAKFNQCLSSNQFDKNVSADLAEGQSIGVSGTPTFFINGTMLVGAQPYASIKAVIDQELAKN